MSGRLARLFGAARPAAGPAGRPARRPAVRLALGEDRIVAVLPGGEPVEEEFASMDALADALERLRGRVGTAGGVGSAGRDGSGGRPGAVSVTWVLLPPLVEVRRVSLLRLKPHETTALLERHAARYFPGAREPQVMAWRRVGPRNASPVDLLVATAPAARLEALHAALEAAGFHPGDPAPAHEAWVAAAPADGAVAVPLGGRVELLGHRGGLLQDAATVPAAAPDRVGVRLDELAGDGAITRMTGEDVGLVAARHAAAVPGPALRLVPAPRRVARALRDRRLSRAFWAAAAVLIVAAGLVELWGLGRELEAVRRERGALAESVASAVAAREVVQGLQATVLTLDSLEGAAPGWSALVADLTTHLPGDAYLAALRAEGDSVAIEGVAAEAAGVFGALRQVPGVSRVVARSPIRREQVGAGAVERFSLAARVRPAVEGGGG